MIAFAMTLPLSATASPLMIGRPDVLDAEVSNPPDFLEPYLDDLDSPDFSVREAASERMKEDTRITDEMILDHLESNWTESTPEQISRLEDVARKRFVSKPGAIGFEFAQGTTAMVGNVRPESPAYGILKPGDRIIDFNGRRLPETTRTHQDALMEELSRYRAGQLVHVLIERNAEEMEIEFRLADPETIPGFDDYIERIDGFLQDRWMEICDTRLPGRSVVMIDMSVFNDDLNSDDVPVPVGVLHDAGARLNDLLYNNALSKQIRERIGQISVRIAEVIETQETASSSDAKAESQQRYLALRSELARLNARLRMLDAIGNNRQRR